MRVEEFYVLTFNVELNPQATAEEAPYYNLVSCFQAGKVSNRSTGL